MISCGGRIVNARFYTISQNVSCSNAWQPLVRDPAPLYLALGTIKTIHPPKESLDFDYRALVIVKQGLPSHKIGRKRVFLKEDLIRWIKEH